MGAQVRLQQPPLWPGSTLRDMHANTTSLLLCRASANSSRPPRPRRAMPPRRTPNQKHPKRGLTPESS
eukprot:3999495-Pleurochrysis_carterae.AAC.1